jgi:archaellum component FlaC
MPTTKELENQVNELKTRVSAVNKSNSALADEVATLKNNYNQLVKDVSVRLEVIHNKIFPPK